MELKGYCVKCKEKGVVLADAKIHETKNGKFMAKGKHSCGTTVCSIMSKENAQNAINAGIELAKE